jgi:signal transduction histidine kinase
MAETFLDEMKRYVGFSDEDARLLRALAPRMEKYLPDLAARFYSQIPHHPDAFRVFVGGQQQIDRLKMTLQHWARGLFCGEYDDVYAHDRFQIGYRHVRIGLDQKYVISAMGIVRAFLSECLLLEFPASDDRLRYTRTLNKMLDLDLNLMCESYMHATVENLRSLNEQLERANLDLAEAGRSKDEFLAQTSHELRTPLNSILGFTKLMLDGLATSPDEQRELLKDVYQSAQLLLGIVNDILDIGRVEAGKVSLHLQDVSPREILDSTLPLVAVQASAKRLELRDETLRSKLPLIRADEVRLRQVMLNLLNNAVKFTEQGAITVRASVDGRAQGPNGFLRFEVEDTGVGIPRDKQAAVFEKFVSAHPAQSRRHGGSGLGLTISRKLVELMGGQIGLSSDGRNRGTRVWFTVPLATADPKTDGPAQP